MKTPRWFLKKNLTALALWPLALIYIVFAKIVFYCRKSRQKRAKIPVICVGGLLAGGVGKTPIVRKLAKNMPKSVVVMRGYGGTKTGLVSKSDSAKTVGDEAKMLSSDIDVITGADRIKSADLAVSSGFETIIMDDGFQNPAIKKDISILVFDEQLGIGNGFGIPAGPLREPLSSGIKRCDAILIIKKENVSLGMARVLKIAKRFNRPVFYAQAKNINPGLRGNVIAFAGIGYPQKFFDGLREFLKPNGVHDFEFIPYPDHYTYSNAELDDLIKRADKSDAMLATTEKDWVKIPLNYQDKIKYVPMGIDIKDSFWTWLNRFLSDQNKKDKNAYICTSL